MNDNYVNLVYALDRDRKLVHVNDVMRGKACSCTCPECGEPLIARQGGRMAWHFAHVSGAKCVTAPETALHMMAKRFVLDAGAVICPPVIVHDGRHNDLDFGFCGRSPDFKLCAEEFVRVSKAGAEDMFGDVVPDVWVRSMDGRGFFVEIKVTHGVDDAKRQKLQALGVPTLEVDFSMVGRNLDPDAFVHVAAERFKKACWVWHPLIDKWDRSDTKTRRAMLQDPFDKLLFDAECPECGGHMRVYWDDSDGEDIGKWYGDCLRCGRPHVASVVSCRFYQTYVDVRVCPECGEIMRPRAGKYGPFWGCSDYPLCKKTIPANV